MIKLSCRICCRFLCLFLFYGLCIDLSSGALGDMRLAWKALIPGGVMLVHDCFPQDHPLGEVRQAVIDFSAEVNVPWTFFLQTMYMAVMQKPDDASYGSNMWS